MYTLVNTQINTIAIPCRSCGKLYEISLSNFTRANKYTVGIACAACGDKFSVRVPPLKRGGPTPHAPDAAVPPCQPCEHGVYGACQKCGTNVPPRR